MTDKPDNASDIAIRLRSHETEGVTSSDRYHLRNEAAAEIDRLRAELSSSESVHRWIECSDHAKLPNCDDVESVLGWFPGMKEPKQVSPETVKHWALDADPIPGAMWMPLPEAPK